MYVHACKMKALLFSLFLSIATAAVIDDEPPVGCLLPSCDRPLCADPVIPKGECCPSCENSQCQFEGCVQFLGRPGSETVQWKPNGCTTCVCADGQTLCGALGCPPIYPSSLDLCANGSLTVTSPTECCASCDYGIPEDECAVVPYYSLTYQLGVEEYESGCSVELTFHQCDKRGYMDDQGRRFQCNPVVRQRSVKLNDNSGGSVTGSCGALAELAFDDVVRCVPTRDENLDVGCDIYVE